MTCLRRKLREPGLGAIAGWEESDLICGGDEKQEEETVGNRSVIASLADNNGGAALIL